MAGENSHPTFFVCQQEPSEHLGAIKEALQREGCEYAVFRRHRENNSRSFDPEDYVGLIVLGGGKRSADQDYAKEKKWIRQALDRHKPVLGICLGAQLLANVCGGAIHHGRVLEKGWKRVVVTAVGQGDLLVKHIAPDAKMFQWHWDMYDLPSKAVNLANSADGKHSEAFLIGRNAYGLQFHPEKTPEMLRNCGALPAIKRSLAAGRKMLDAWIRLALAEGPRR